MALAPSHVLVVEDDPDIRLTVADCLEFDGWEVVQACDGIDALEALEAHPLPAAILLDLMMPRMDGRAFLARLRADPRFAAIPVIIMTAMTSASASASSLDAQAFLRKPFDLGELCDAIARCAGGQAELRAAGA